MRQIVMNPHWSQLSPAALFPVNCFVVREADGLTLIDTGVASTASLLVRALRRQDLPLRRIVLSHAHEDHAGGLDALGRAFPQAELCVGRREAAFLRGDLGLEPHEATHPLRGQFRRCARTPDRLLEPGDRVGSLEVLAAPGHTPGHLAFLDTRAPVLMVADALSGVGGLVVSGTPHWRFPLPGKATWNPARALETARHLRALEPQVLAMGHGDALHQPLAALDRALERAAQHPHPSAHLPTLS